MEVVGGVVGVDVDKGKDGDDVGCCSGLDDGC